MRIKLENIASLGKAISFINSLIGKTIEIKEVKGKRSNQQNNALHLYFKLIAEQFNNLGWTYNYSNPYTGYLIELPWNTDLVKDFIWRPIQLTLYGVKSTTEINTKQINEIIDVLSLHFGKHDIKIEFPNWQSWMNELDKIKYNE